MFGLSKSVASISSLSTPIDALWAFAIPFTIDKPRPVDSRFLEKVLEALREGDDTKLAQYMGNSLEDAAVSINKEIRTIKEFLHSAGLKLVLMSGSGSSVFALSTDKMKLKRIERSIYEEGRWFVELTKIIK